MVTDGNVIPRISAGKYKSRRSTTRQEKRLRQIYFNVLDQLFLGIALCHDWHANGQQEKHGVSMSPCPWPEGERQRHAVPDRVVR